MPVKIKGPDRLAPRIDEQRTAEAVNRAHAEHCKRALLAGRRAEGGALPRNDQGKPRGRGDGTIAHRWVINKTSHAPYQEGGYYYAVRSLGRHDIDLVSTAGEAGKVIDQVLEQLATEAIK
jgi:hypothetical protein